MKSTVIAEIERIAGDRLTPAMREEIAECTMKIIDKENKIAAMAVLGGSIETSEELEAAKGTLIDAAKKNKPTTR